MTKIGRKGFMLAEALIVSVVVATVLITLFTGLNNVSSAYETRNRYYDVDSLYAAIEFNNIILRNTTSLNGIITEANYLYTWASKVSSIEQSKIQKLNEFYESEVGDTVSSYITPYDKNEMLSLESFDSKTAETFSDYLEYLSGNLNFDEDYDYMIIVERREKKDINDCYYYALKLKY